jgi:hypothetical protein
VAALTAVIATTQAHMHRSRLAVYHGLLDAVVGLSQGSDTTTGGDVKIWCCACTKLSQGISSLELIIQSRDVGNSKLLNSRLLMVPVAVVQMKKTRWAHRKISTYSHATSEHTAGSFMQYVESCLCLHTLVGTPSAVLSLAQVQLICKYRT